MALNFPDSPANGDTTTLNGVSYTYDSTKTVWVSTTGPITTVAVSDNAPATPTDGDMWFNSSDLKLYIRYNDGATSQWIIAAPAGPAGADSTVAGPSGGDGRAGVYADMAALIAKTGMVAGDTALVTALNKVFMYTGSAWYLIATMTNASPTAITGVNAAYNLATDGTATIITAVSTDPEGFPLTWSYAVTTGSLGSTATVSQADNVFTITPSTTEADAGSFSITFSVTDGATGAVNAVSAFTLAFSHEFIVSEIQNSSNANYDISGMFPGNTVCTLSSSYTTSGSDTLVTDTSGTQWKLFASFTNNATSTRWGGNKEVQGQLSTYDFSDLTTPRLPPYTGILSYGDIKIYGPNNGLGGGAGGYGYYSDGSAALFNSVKLDAVAWAPLTAAQGASSGYAYNGSTPTAGWENGGPNVAGGWAQQSGGFMVIKPPQGTSEMWITGFNAWQGGGTSYIIFNESDGAITSQSGHGSGTASGLGPANATDAGMLNDAGTYTTILPITDGQLFMQHEMGPQACGIAYVLTR